MTRPAPESLQTLFERFRREGDAAALEQVFDRTAPELMKLALHLARTLEQAEDLVQSTFLAAIQGAGAWDSDRHLMPWLLGILANQAGKARRAAGRLPDPTRLTERSNPEPPDEAGRRELDGALLRTLDELPERYREVLVPHLVEGKRAVEIAQDLQRAPGTVRMQILRGLERLRRGLPPGFATGLAVLPPPPRGLAVMKALVLEKAAAVAPAAAGAGAGLTLTQVSWLGGLAMSIPSALALTGAAALALTLAWLALGSDGEVAVDTAELARTAGETPEPAARPTDRIEPLERGARRTIETVDPAEGPSAAGPTPGWWLVGELSGLSAGEPPRVFAWDPDGELDPVEQQAAPDGSFALDLSTLFVAARERSLELLIGVQGEPYLSVNDMLRAGPGLTGADPGERHEIRRDYLLEPVMGLAGRLELPLDGTWDEPRVALFRTGPEAHPAADPVLEQGVEEDGRWKLVTTEAGEFLLVASCEGLAPLARLEVVVPGVLREVAPLRLEPGEVSISGRVVGPLGSDPEGSRVRALRVGSEALEEEGSWGDLVREGERVLEWQKWTRAGQGGRFELRGLEPGGWRLSLESFGEAGIVLDPAALEVVAPTDQVRIGQELGRIAVEVVEGGRPSPRVELIFACEGGGPFHAFADDAGRLEAFGPLSSAYRLHGRRGEVAEGELELPAGLRSVDERVVLELHPVADRSATLELELTGPPAALPAEVRLHLFPSDSPEGGDARHRLELRRELDSGLVRVEGLPPGAWRLVVEPWEDRYAGSYQSFLLAPTLDLRLEPSATEHHSLPFTLGGRLRIESEGAELEDVPSLCRVIDSAGREVFWPRFVSRTYAGDVLMTGVRAGCLSFTEDAELYPNLAPGAWRFEIEAEGYRPIARPFVIRPGQVTTLTLKPVLE